MTKEYGSLISEYTVNHTKFLLNKITIFAGLPLFALIFFWYDTGNDIFLILTPITAIFAIATLIAYRSYKPASIKAYQNGIEVQGWGFSQWNAISMLTEPNIIVLFWKMTTEEFSQKSLPHGANSYAHSEDHNCAVIIFSADRFCTNISAYNFYEAVKDYLGGPAIAPPPAPKNPGFFKIITTNLLFGNENPDLKHVIKCILFYVICAVLLRYAINSFTLLSSIWGKTGLFIISGAILFSLIFAMQTKKK